MLIRLRQLGTLLFIAFVIFVPFFELYDEGKDFQEGTDVVQSLLFALTVGTLAVLLRTIAGILIGYFGSSTLSQHRTLETIHRRRPGIEGSPPQLCIALCTIRI